MDEHLVGEIVRQPADPALRQAYAEALREEDPQRSQLITAELAWHSTRTAAALADLEQLASGLDPVWVARICRPPAGVCCDRVRWEPGAAGPPRPAVLPEQLAWLENRFHLRLPSDYRAFLLNYNGGCPAPGYLRLSLPQERAGCNRWLSYACSLWQAADSSLDWDLDLVWRLQQLESDVRQGGRSEQELARRPGWEREMALRWRTPPRDQWIVIGAGAPTGELEWFCLDCTPGDSGPVYCVDVTAEFPLGPDACLVAASFREFLALLGSE
ncbi:MAG: SMI1/KNR4 family protein [Pirellulales bacterium]